MISLPAFIWTGKQIIDAFASVPSDYSPCEDILFSAKSFLAIVTNIENNGINFFSSLFEANKTVDCHTIICLYKDCLTNQEYLKKLISLEQQYSPRINIKVLLLNNQEDILSSIFCINTLDNKTLLSLGSFLKNGNYLTSNPKANNMTRTNLGFSPEDELLEVFYKWYECLWLEDTSSLTESLNNPSVVSLLTRNGESEQKSFDNLEINNKENKPVNVTPVININNKNENLGNVSPTKSLNIFRQDPFVLEIARIYELGEIVTLDRKNSIPPLDVPIKAEWVGVKGLETIGELTQEIRYRISVIDEALLRQIEKKKTSVRDLINNFTFSMGDNLRWMPLEAKPLFVKELDRVNKEGKELIKQILGDNIWKYLNERKVKIKEDVQKIQNKFVDKIKSESNQLYIFTEEDFQLDLFREENPSQLDLSRETVLSKEPVYIRNILSQIAKRLTKAKECNFIPSVNYNKISFNYKESKWSSPWSQVLKFLTSIAEFFRKNTYEVFLRHTPSINYKEYIQAMNVCGDGLIQLIGVDNFSYVQKQSLQTLEYITKMEIEAETIPTEEGKKLFNKCIEVFNLIKSNTLNTEQLTQAGQLMPLDPDWSEIAGQFVYIPAGEFMMGSGSSEYDYIYEHFGSNKDTKPLHQVRISRHFEMGQYPVTQQQWETVMGNNPSFSKGATLPVECVSWEDAQVFIQVLNSKSSKYLYRLPTEAEWEYACRAGTTGDYSGNLNLMGWYGENSGGSTTHPVGQKQPNAWGLYDMYGNVEEFCQDWYDPEYYAFSPVVDPQGADSGVHRVMRGGSWDTHPAYCCSGTRHSISPDYSDFYFGFRLVRTVRSVS